MCEENLRTSQSCEDILGVISLPLEIYEYERSSFLQQYVNEKSQEHDNRFTKFQSDIYNVNVITDENIKQSKDLSREEINLILNNNFLEKISDIQSTDQWLAGFEELHHQSKRLKMVVDEYFLDIKDLEQKRVINIKDILRDYKEEAIKLRLCSPDETNKLLEGIINEFNNKMVNNAQYHEDVKLYTNLKVTQYLDECAGQLQNKALNIADIRAQKMWKKIKEKQNQRLVVKTIFNLTEENVKAREEISQATSHLVSELSEFAEVLNAPNDADMDEDFWKQWIGILNTRLESLESLSERVHLLLKTAITTLLETFDYKINSLLRTLYPNVENLSESICTDQEVLNEIHILREEQEKELKIIHENWQVIMDALSKKIYQSKIFVSDLTLIWTNHTNRRIKLATELEVELGKLKQKWLKEESIINLKVKKQKKDIREAKDLKKLEHSFGVLENTLCDLKAKQEKNYDTQLQKVEAVRQIAIDQLIEGQISDIKEFLFVKYPKTKWFDDSLSSKLKCSGTDQDTQIEMCNTYMKSVDNRTLGMHEMLERYLPSCPYVIMGESEDWLYNCMQDILTNYETESEEIARRHEETLQELKQTRSAELKVHSDRLLSHSSGIKSTLANLNKQYEDIKLHQQDKILKFNKKIQLIFEDNNNLNFSKQIKDYISQINQDWTVMSNTLEISISEAKKCCYSQIKELNESNNMFCHNAKSFKNGGNYSPEELKTMKKEINQLKKLITKHNTNLNESYNNLSKQLNRNIVDANIFELQKKLDEIKLEEDLITSVNAIRLRLRRSASNLWAMGDTVKQKMHQLREMSEKCLNNLNSLDSFHNTLEEIIETFNKRAGYLKTPCELLTPECYLNIDEIVSDSSNEGLEYVNEEEIPINPKSFLQESKEYVLKEFLNMDKKIKKVLGTAKVTKKVLKKDSGKTHHNENEHEKSVANLNNQLKLTLLNYYEDCKSVHIQESQNHLEQFISLQSIVNLTMKQSFHRVHNTYVVNLNDLKKWYDKSVKHHCEVGELSRNKMQRNFILPLAHPNHKEKLSELFNKAKDICVNQNKDFVEMLSTYKGTLQNMHNTYAQKISSLRKIFEGMEAILPDFKSLKKSLSEISVQSHKHYFEGMENKVIGHPFIKYPISIWSRKEKEQIDKLTQFFSKSKSKEVTINSQGFEQVCAIELATENLKMSADNVQHLYDEARHGFKQFEEANKRWLYSFTYDMNQAKLIHTKV